MARGPTGKWSDRTGATHVRPGRPSATEWLTTGDKEYSYRLRVRGIHKYDVPDRRDKWPADNKNGLSTRREINDDEETGGARDRGRRRYPVVVSVACRTRNRTVGGGEKYHVAQYITLSLSLTHSQCTHRSPSVFHNGRSSPMVINDLLNFICLVLVCILRSTGPTRSPRYTSWLLCGSVLTCTHTHITFQVIYFYKWLIKYTRIKIWFFFLFFFAIG